MNVRTKHWTLKPHRNMRQHKVFLRHELLKYNSEKSTAKSSALENYISSANLSLSGCSSAEPNSVSVGRCKFQLKKLYLQTVKKVDHLPKLSNLVRQMSWVDIKYSIAKEQKIKHKLPLKSMQKDFHLILLWLSKRYKLSMPHTRLGRT